MTRLQAVAPTPDALVLAFPGNERIAFDIAMALGAELGLMEWRHFPDGESYVRLVTDPEHREVIVVATQQRPDAQFLPLVFLADVARELGARRVGLVAPYLAYLRQDRRFRRGEAVSSRSFGRLVSRAVDWLVTVDPHLHRLTSLAEVYDIPARAVDVAPLLGAWVRTHVTRPLVVGPDAESAQWVRVVAEAADAPFVVLDKTRHGDEEVTVTIPRDLPDTGHTAVLVDDIVSSGQTIIAAAHGLRAAGFAAPVSVIVHPLLAGDAFEEIARAGVARVVSCNTVAHPSNAIDVAPAIVAALRPLAVGEGPQPPPRRRRLPRRRRAGR